MNNLVQWKKQICQRHINKEGYTNVYTNIAHLSTDSWKWTINPHGLNEKLESKFQESYKLSKTPEENQRISVKMWLYQPKWGY